MASDPLDPDTDQGSWIHDYISVDYIDENGQFGYIDEWWEDTFHVDTDNGGWPEWTEEYWPKVCAGNLYWDDSEESELHLHTDYRNQGELNCWIAAIPCEWYEYQGVRLRVRDDVNNWTRSDNLAPGDADVEIACPGDTIPYDDPVELTAQITGNQFYAPLEDNIKWSVQFEVERDLWVDFGPHEDIYHQYSDSGYNSEISENIANWCGTTFTIDHFRDCEMRVRARLEVCGVVFDDTCDVEDDTMYEIVDIIFRESRYPDPQAWNDDCHHDFNANDDNNDSLDKRQITHPETVL